MKSAQRGLRFLQIMLQMSVRNVDLQLCGVPVSRGFCRISYSHLCHTRPLLCLWKVTGGLSHDGDLAGAFSRRAHVQLWASVRKIVKNKQTHSTFNLGLCCSLVKCGFSGPPVLPRPFSTRCPALCVLKWIKRRAQRDACWANQSSRQMGENTNICNLISSGYV